MENLERVKEKCLECPLCQQECLFLQKYGTPKSIAARFDPDDPKLQTLAFECSLCGLCTAVCPVGLNPAEMFLEMRRAVVQRGGGNFPEYARLLNYEKRGTSRRYSYYGFPAACDSVFFPGCTFSGTRPATALKVFDSLSRKIPHLGIVLDCCTKPSHDLGREAFFKSLFGEMKGYLLKQGIKTVLTACPNCYGVFQQYGRPLEVRTVYEVLAETPSEKGGIVSGGKIVHVHDPCVIRFEKPIQDAVRVLIDRSGATVEEMDHHRERTLCCGEGGAVGRVAPALAAAWSNKRKREGAGKSLLTYCAGCAGSLNRITPTHHVLDFFYDPEVTLSGKARIYRAPLTYRNRLRLKKQFRKKLPAFPRERNFKWEEKVSHLKWVKRVMVLLLAAGIVFLKL